MKFTIANQANGKMCSITVDDEAKWGKLIDLRMGQEFDGGLISDDLAGYVLKLTGGMDKQGFSMKQGIFIAGRTKLLLAKGLKGFFCNRTGERRRKSVRGCIVGRDLGTIHTTISKIGDKPLEGVTDVTNPKRLGPKRANKIRAYYGLPRHWDIQGKKTGDDEKVEVDTFDVTRYVVKRYVENDYGHGKRYYKAPNIQRLITAQKRRRKRDRRTTKLGHITENQKLYKAYIKGLKDAKKTN